MCKVNLLRHANLIPIPILHSSPSSCTPSAFLLKLKRNGMMVQTFDLTAMVTARLEQDVMCKLRYIFFRLFYIPDSCI